MTDKACPEFSLNSFVSLNNFLAYWLISSYLFIYIVIFALKKLFSLFSIFLHRFALLLLAMLPINISRIRRMAYLIVFLWQMLLYTCLEFSDRCSKRSPLILFHKLSYLNVLRKFEQPMNANTPSTRHDVHQGS